MTIWVGGAPRRGLTPVGGDPGTQVARAASAVSPNANAMTIAPTTIRAVPAELEASLTFRVPPAASEACTTPSKRAS